MVSIFWAFFCKYFFVILFMLFFYVSMVSISLVFLSIPSLIFGNSLFCLHGHHFFLSVFWGAVSFESFFRGRHVIWVTFFAVFFAVRNSFFNIFNIIFSQLREEYAFNTLWVWCPREIQRWISPFSQFANNARALKQEIIKRFFHSQTDGFLRFRDLRIMLSKQRNHKEGSIIHNLWIMRLSTIEEIIKRFYHFQTSLQARAVEGN